MSALASLRALLRTAILAAVFLAALGSSADVARAQGPAAGSLALRWDACYGDGGSSARTFACNTNTGFELLVVTAYPPVAMPQFNGATAEIQLRTPSGDMPGWWQFQTGACRSGQVFALFTRPGGASSCADPWQGMAAGGTSYQPYYSYTPDWYRLRVVMAMPGSVPVAASAELFLCAIRITHSRTVGTCAGCLSGLCIGLAKVQLTQPAGVGDYTVLAPLPGTNSDVVGWQMGDVSMPYTTYVSPSLGPIKEYTGCTAATASRTPTWGAVKSLYR